MEVVHTQMVENVLRKYPEHVLEVPTPMVAVVKITAKAIVRSSIDVLIKILTKQNPRSFERGTVIKSEFIFLLHQILWGPGLDVWTFL